MYFYGVNKLLLLLLLLEVQVLKEKTQKLDKSVKEIEESVNLNDEDISDVKRD